MAKRRNHMIRSNRSPVRTAVTVAVVVALLGGVFLATRPGGGDTGARTPASAPVDVVAPSGPLTASLLGEESTGDGATIRLYIDGWTHRILDGRNVTLTLPDGRFAKVNFTALDADSISGLLDGSSHVVAPTISRLVDGDQRLVCDADGCRADDRSVDAAALLADPSSIGGLGASYKAWGITSGLYEGRVVVPAETEQFSVGAEGYVGTQLLYLTGENGDIATGFGSGAFLLGAAWGRLFPIEARWVQSADGAGDAVRSIRRAVTGNGAGADVFIGDRLLAGPADRSNAAVAASAGLNPSQLTYLSSPVTGCGPAVVCTPAVVPVTKSKVQAEQAKVCEGDARGVLAVRNYTLTVTLPHPTHLGGMWPAATDNIFEGSENASGVLGYFGRAPLVNGKVTASMSVIELADAAGVVALAGSRTPEPGEQFSLAQLPELFGGALARC
jgi:hypothetical protein